MTSARHLRIVRITRVVCAILGVSLWLPILLSGQFGELGVREALWFFGGLAVATLLPEIVSASLKTTCAQCNATLSLKTATFQAASQAGGGDQLGRSELRYWCSNCKKAEVYPATWSDKLFNVTSSSSSSNSSSEADTFGE